ncbi:MAG: YfhO family protein [Paludibacteraceae bacterium]
MLNATLDSLGVLNMLNMKYVIVSNEHPPIVNTHANGNVWFVEKIRVANDANEEMKLLGEIDTKKELVIDKSLASALPKTLIPDSTAKIALASYQPNHLVYHFDSKTDQVAVFSEIYYGQGWKATINGKEAPYTRVNYLLRAMPLNAGNYDIEFRFDPQSYKIGNTLAMVCSILLILLIAGYVYFRLIKKKDILIFSNNHIR